VRLEAVLAIFWPLVAAERVVVFDNMVHVERSLWRAIAIGPLQAPVTVECSYTVFEGGSGIRAALMSRGEAERFRDRRSHRPAISTPYQMKGGFRHRIDQAGDYLVVLDNRMEGRSAAAVRLRVVMNHEDPAPGPARMLSSRRRLVVVVTSVLFFVVVSGWSGRRVWRAHSARHGFREPAGE